MNGSFVASIFYCFAWAALAGSFFFYRKTETKSYAITWMGLTILLTTCYQTFCAAILNVAGVPINIVSIGIIDLFPALWFGFQIMKTKKIQKYCLEKVDIIFCVLLAALMLYLCVGHYAGRNFWINYGTIDPAAHLKAAVDVIRNQCVNNMFYSALFNGLFLEIFLPVRRLDFMFQPFVISDILNYGLAGLMFFGLIRRYMTKRFAKIAGVIITLIYVSAYPLNSILYGFVYLGMGVTLVIMLIELTRIFLAEELNYVFSIVLLSLGCLAIFECYVLFMPVVFFAIISCVFVKQYGKKKLISKETVLTCLGIFLIPCVIGIYYTYFGIFTGGVTVENQIATEGDIYRELYSNFLPFLPFALYEFFNQIKERKNKMALFLFPYSLLFMLVMFAGGMMGKVSSYYYYKLPYMFWVPLMYLCFLGALRVAEKAKGIVISGYVVWLCVFISFFIGVENKIREINDLYDPRPKANEYNDIYSFNYGLFTKGGYPFYKMELYHYVYENLLEQGEEVVAIASWWQDDIWFQAITNQRLDGWDFLSADHTAYYQKLRECGANYVVVLTDDFSLIYHDNMGYWDSLEKIYENEEGFVAKLDLESLNQ